MYRVKRTGIFLIIFIILNAKVNYCVSQPILYNLSTRSGLPSNHVYRTIVDKHGYLWLATSKGVVKYNGYDTKVFNAKNGLPNEDVWNLFEDKKGRIWLASISNEIGFIRNDKYCKATIKNPINIYPMDFIDYDQGIMFITSNKINTEIICVERNDTIVNCIDIHSKKVKYMLQHNLHPNMIVAFFDPYIYCGQIINNKFIYRRLKTQIHPPRNRPIILQGKYFIPEIKQQLSDTLLHIVDIENDRGETIYLNKEEELINAIYYRGANYITTTKSIYKYDNNFNLLSSTPIDTVGLVSEADPITLIDDYRWERVISTNNGGVFFQFADNYFKENNNGFVASKYVGRYKDSVYFFWNANERIFSSYDRNAILIKKQHLKIPFVHKAIGLSRDSVIILNKENTFLLTGKNLNYYIPQKTTPYWIGKDSIMFSIPLSQRAPINIMSYVKIQDLIIDNSNLMHMVSMGNNYANQYVSKDSVVMHVIDSSRYEKITSYPLTRSYIVQGKKQIFIDNGNNSFKISSDQLALLGINNVEQILVDSFGNIFIKASDNLFAYNPFTAKFTTIYKDYNLVDASIQLYKNHIVAVGRFGIVCSKVLPTLKLSKTASLINFKAQKYFNVSETYIVGDNLYMNTDMGSYKIDLPNITTGFKQNNFPKYILYASSSLFNDVISQNDTILISQKDPTINFDFINPYGDGKVKYTYTIDGEANSNWISADRVTLPILEPGKYHTINLKVNDDSWRSHSYIISIYPEAYWWQSANGKKYILLLSLFLLGALTFVVVLTTKHILNRRHAKANKYLELELKSIYAQLNPHFIFNTLSNIIYYIKKDKKTEAYKYLNSFSKLLRSYIKSSRNKWLPLSEELSNIENYIQLQQARFEDKFEYTINVDPLLNTDSILLPSLLLQPLVENAIHHGLQQKPGKGCLSLSFNSTNNENTIIIKIEDDGIGRTKAKEFAKNSLHKKESFGSNLIEDLITIYKRYELFSIDIDYYDKQFPHTGTIVTLTIKYEP